jgi:nucleoside-diphosphate-sugar epimerase
MKTVLITGGAGNLGRHVADELSGNGYRVVLFDRYSPDKVAFPWECKYPFLLGDQTSFEDCVRAISNAKPDVIVHNGAITHDSDIHDGKMNRPNFKMFQPEDNTMRINVMGTYYMMDAARRFGVKKIVFGSSYYVLGLGFRISNTPYQVDYLPIDEKHPNRPEDTYSTSKLIGEEIVESFCRSYGMKGVAFRYMGISYPFRPHPFNVNPLEHKKDGHVGGPIGTTHQYSDARDIAYATRLAIDKDLPSHFEAFYISTDNTFKGDTAPIVKALYPDIAHMADNIKGEDSIISDKKLRDMLGYSPKYSWR